MISKLIQNSYWKIKNTINEKISSTKEWISNIVLVILLSTWAWIATKAEANIQHDFQTQDTHKVVKWDWLIKVAKQYWLTLTELKKLNKWKKYGPHNLISDDNTIFLWSILTVSKNSIFNIDNITDSVQNKVSNITKEKKVEEKENTIQLDNTNIEQNDNVNIELSKAIKNSAMYHKVWGKFKKFYTISPKSNTFEWDTPVFTWSIKKLSWKLYAEVRLANDKYITWYVRFSAFDEQSQAIINQNNKKGPNTGKKVNSQKITKKTTQKLVKNESIKIKTIKKTIVSKQEIIEEQILTKRSRTETWSKNSKNPIQINSKTESILTKEFDFTDKLLKRIPTEEQRIKYLRYRISVYKLLIDFKEIHENISYVDLYDDYCTLARKNISSREYTSQSFDNFHKNVIEKKYNGDWNKWIEKVSLALWITKEEFFKKNPDIKIKLDEGIKKWVKDLLTFIAKIESRWNYNAIYWKFKQDKVDYTNMTLVDLMKDMTKRINKTKYSATWKYQVILETLELFINTRNNDKNPLNDIDINTQKYSKLFQEELGHFLLEKRWIYDYAYNDLQQKDVQLNISMEWAAVAKDESNESYHKWTWDNKAYCTNEQIDTLLENIRNPKPETETLVASL